MDENRLRYLYQRFNDRTATNTEIEEFYNALSEPEFEHVIKSIIENTWDTMTPLYLTKVNEESADQIYQNIVSARKQSLKSKVSWPRIAVAAAIATVVFGAGLYYFNKDKQNDQNQTAYQNDIMPGNVGATLTLSNGKKINLSSSANQELAREAGVIISKTSDGKLVYQVSDDDRSSFNKINTLSTQNGETYQVKLPDGTSVWLNAESSISYPASFTGLKERTVQLKGEAYLEVAKDKAHPFVVKTDRQDVQVLGTHFNVYAYSGEPVKTALAEGSVKITAASKSKMIVPGQQTVVANNEIKIEPADLGETLAWKDGDFDFNSESITSIMTVLSRWYDMDVVYQGELPTDKFNARISRARNLSMVLKMLEVTKSVHFKIEGRRIIVMK